MPPKTNELPHKFVEHTGYIAFNNGYDLSDNPYDMWGQYERFHDWRNGWKMAEKEAYINAHDNAIYARRALEA